MMDRAAVKGIADANRVCVVGGYLLAGQLSRPVLLAHGTRDQREPLQTLAIRGEGPSFSGPENAQAWFDALDAYLAKEQGRSAAK